MVEPTFRHACFMSGVGALGSVWCVSVLMACGVLTASACRDLVAALHYCCLDSRAPVVAVFGADGRGFWALFSLPELGFWWFLASLFGGLAMGLNFVDPH